MTPETTVAVENQHVTVDETVACTDISHKPAHHIVYNIPQFNKDSARLVPHQLTVEMKDWGIDACEELLQCSEAEGDSFLWRIVTEDDTWVQYQQPKTKTAITKRHHSSSSPKPKKILHTFIGWTGYVDSLLEWTRGNFGALQHTQGRNVHQSNICKSSLEQLTSCYQLQTTWNLSTVVLLQHDNAHPHKKCLCNTCIIFSRPCTSWYSCVWSTQRGTRRHVFQAWQRGYMDRAQVARITT